MGLLQGDPASSLLFTATVNRLMQPLVDRWNREDLGFKIGKERICLFAWMDDLYLFASSREDLQKMVRQTCQVTRPVGLLLQPAKCLWATNRPDAEEMSITAAGVVVPRVPRNEGFAVVLGTLVTMSSDPTPEWNHRVSKTWRAFWANSRLLLNERVSSRRRIRVWSSCVASVFLWGLAALTLTLSMMRTIDICQREMVAKIMRRRRRPAESWLDWHVRTRRLAGKFLAECQVLPLSILALKRKLSWAGHLARLPHDRLVYKTWFWRNMAWWRLRQTWISFGAGDFRHRGQIGFPRRWETSIEKFQHWCRDVYHDHRNWDEIALDRDLWYSLTCEYLEIPEVHHDENPPA